MWAALTERVVDSFRLRSVPSCRNESRAPSRSGNERRAAQSKRRPNSALRALGGELVANKLSSLHIGDQSNMTMMSVNSSRPIGCKTSQHVTVHSFV